METSLAPHPAQQARDAGVSAAGLTVADDAVAIAIADETVSPKLMCVPRGACHISFRSAPLNDRNIVPARPSDRGRCYHKPR